METSAKDNLNILEAFKKLINSKFNMKCDLFNF